MSLLLAIGLTVFPFIPPAIISRLMGGRKNIRERRDGMNLDKPSWYPPRWLFGPVWSMLYVLMGYASFLIVRDGIGQDRKLALGLYASSMIFKSVGNPAFSGIINRTINFSAIALLACNVAACIWAYYPINETAAYMMLPYLAWSTFASILSFSIWQRNKKSNID